jgi:hypothetical protein
MFNANTDANTDAVNGAPKEMSRLNKNQPKKEQKTNYWCWLMACCCIDWELPTIKCSNCSDCSDFS